ncbi:glycosyl hydrolase 115 family protein [Arachidicoccus terrestris]|uniref:glycosyl hydrolase 115 family protein n=1 Tax=Arachidicoccus terrestris TaxID=2875539 RepID=UPI001CC58644|nr:glycosyl hydrolase 115 family protein [Arachidicoccus terrestris]
MMKCKCINGLNKVMRRAVRILGRGHNGAGDARFVIGFIAAVMLLGTAGYSQVTLTSKASDNKGAGMFNLSGAKILEDPRDPVAVNTYVRLFAKDIQNVTGKAPGINRSLAKADNLVIAGTIEANRWIKALIAAGKINVDSIKGAWERYGIFLVKNPFRHVGQALVIAGSDRRAVAFGLFSISKVIGVSPWYFWADVPVKKRSDVVLSVSNFTSPAPSVKYRGVFINDEDWGLRPWARDTYEKELHNIGPKTYRQVFELLLRLNANYLCPAMHPGSSAFNKYPENKVIADSFGIVMGSTHPEPLLFNNASEWDKKTMGEWDYKTNRTGIMRVLDKRVKENSPYENVYTLALRGLHDKEMQGDYPMSERLKLVEEALNDQRSILKKYIDTPLADIPQIFVPYKEVLDIYNAGLKLPDEVTLVWPDDNYGYLKQLSNEKERLRSGHSGVYYHASYLGRPHDYLWLASTPPNLMYEELHKAYATGADRYWLLNAGDIKSCEAPVTQFLSMAYQLDSFSFSSAPEFQAEWLSDIYGKEYFQQLARITKTYNRLAFSRKPESMAWGFEWNSNRHAREIPAETEYSFDNYNEAQDRISDYLKIQNDAKKIYDGLPEAYKPSFYELVLYPVTGASLMNRMWLKAQQQRDCYYEHNSAANRLKKEVDVIHDSLKAITDGYNRLLNGKWNHVISLVNGVTASYFEKPKLKTLKLPGNGQLKVKAEGSGTTGVNGYTNMLPTFDKLAAKTHYFDLYNTGSKVLSWTARANAPWVKLSRRSGKVQDQQRVEVAVDWNQLKESGRKTAIIDIVMDGGHQQVLVAANNPAISCDSLQGLYVEENGVVSIPAAGFSRKVESYGVEMQLVNDLGYTDTSVMMGSPVLPVINSRYTKAPNLQYDFYTFHRGMVKVYTYVLPTFPLSSNRDFGFHEANTSQTTYGVTIDDGIVDYPSSSSPEYSQNWATNVERNAAINVSTLYIDRPGKHTLKIITGDPGIIVQKIVIDLGGLKPSYMGPQPTTVSCDNSGTKGK